jgi:hypothetical protein
LFPARGAIRKTGPKIFPCGKSGTSLTACPVTTGAFAEAESAMDSQKILRGCGRPAINIALWSDLVTRKPVPKGTHGCRDREKIVVDGILREAQNPVDKQLQLGLTKRLRL